MANSGTPIENNNTFTPDNNGYEICHRSGWKARPYELIREWTGNWVLPFFSEQRNFQDLIRSPGPEAQPGPHSPEPETVFIVSRVLPTDL